MVDSARECRQSVRWFRNTGLGLGLLACGGGGTTGTESADASGNASCTALKAGDPVTLDAEVQVLASDGAQSRGLGSLTPAVVAGGGEVYWCDDSGSVFVARQDERVVELSHMDVAAQKPVSALVLATNSANVYVGYAYGGIDDTGMPDYHGRGRLLSISKQDGRVTSLLEDEQGWFAPITADDGRVIVFASSSDELGFYQVPLDHPRLEALPLGTVSFSPGGGEPSDRNTMFALWDKVEQGQLVGDQVYWRAYTLGPVRSGFDDAEPELLSDRVPSNSSFTAGPGYIVTLKAARDSGYYNVGLDFVRTDDAGCRSVQGPRGEVLGDVALDARYAYWSGYRTSASDAASSESSLSRVDLETGAVARLNLPNVTLHPYHRLVGQDDTRLFLWNDGALLSIRKP